MSAPSSALDRIAAALTRQGAVPLDIVLGWMMLGLAAAGALLCIGALLLWGWA